jgi:predicted transcriptional regulator
MAFEKELAVLIAVKQKKRAKLTWKTICRIYAALRKEGLIVRAGKSHAITERGQRFLDILGER